MPLAGVKIADFSWIGVGPIAAKVLADHGAQVVHIETENPADRLRLVGPFKDGIAGINRCQFFGSFNTSKLSLTLNLKTPEGIEIAKKLLAWCDVALDSFTAGTMNELGIGYDVAREPNPNIFMATTCLLGQTGPAAQWAGPAVNYLALGGFLAAPVFASSVVAIPLLLDRRVGVLAAVLTSWRTVLVNPLPLALWAALLMGLTVGIATALVGLVGT